LQRFVKDASTGKERLEQTEVERDATEVVDLNSCEAQTRKILRNMLQVMEKRAKETKQLRELLVESNTEVEKLRESGAATTAHLEEFHRDFAGTATESFTELGHLHGKLSAVSDQTRIKKKRRCRSGAST